MTQQRSDEAHWSERGIYQLMTDADPRLRDELMIAWAARDEALARAERAEAQRDEALALLTDAIPDPKGAIDSPRWHQRMDALAASLAADA